MEVYESPKMEVIAFDNEDVITTSCTGYCHTNDCPQDFNGGT
jgi:hypothetical protein